MPLRTRMPLPGVWPSYWINYKRQHTKIQHHDLVLKCSRPRQKWAFEVVSSRRWRVDLPCLRVDSLRPLVTMSTCSCPIAGLENVGVSSPAPPLRANSPGLLVCRCFIALLSSSSFNSHGMLHTPNIVHSPYHIIYVNTKWTFWRTN